MFIITELVVKLARVYYHKKLFNIDLQSLLQPSDTFYMARFDGIDVCGGFLNLTYEETYLLES